MPFSEQDGHQMNMFTFGAENIQELQDDDSADTRIKCLQLGMRDQIDCDISLYLYSAIDFIEKAQKKTNGHAKILIHCYKVKIHLT
jgi:protein-tyrosine phosphatase